MFQDNWHQVSEPRAWRWGGQGFYAWGSGRAPQLDGGWLGQGPGSQAALEREVPGAARLAGGVAAALWEWGEDGVWEAALGSVSASSACSWPCPPGSQLLWDCPATPQGLPWGLIQAWMLPREASLPYPQPHSWEPIRPVTLLDRGHRSPEPAVRFCQSHSPLQLPICSARPGCGGQVTVVKSPFGPPGPPKQRYVEWACVGRLTFTPCLSTVDIINSHTKRYKVTIIVPIIQTRTLRLRDTSSSGQHHRTAPRWNQDSNAGLSTSLLPPPPPPESSAWREEQMQGRMPPAHRMHAVTEVRGRCPGLSREGAENSDGRSQGRFLKGEPLGAR